MSLYIASMDYEPTRIPSLSPKEMLILRMLVGAGELFGLEMVAKSDGDLKRGTVYVTLNRMEEKGYVESRQEEQAPGAIGLPRRLYKASGYGARVLQAWEMAGASLAWEGAV